MTSPGAELPDDIQSCQALIEQLRMELSAAVEQIAHLEGLLARHQETIVDQEQAMENLAADNALLKRSLFGSRRERFADDPAQTLLFEAAPPLESSQPDDQQAPPPAEPKKRTSQGRQVRVFPDFLPRQEQRHYLNPEDIPEELRDNPSARRFFKKVGETLELIPMRLRVIEQFQEVIALDLPDETTRIVSAKRPVPLIQSFAGPSLWAYLTVSRFADHLPYYRLEDILGRSGFRIDRSTQWRWMRGLAGGVTPLVELMWKRALLSEVLGMDETPVMELGGPGRTLKGYLWAGVGDANHPYDCFFYTSDRRSIQVESMLAGFQGYLTADAYIAYERIGALWPGVFKASCWAHGRRKFEACHHLGATAQTRTALSYFQKLFDLEDLHHRSRDEARLAARRYEAIDPENRLVAAELESRWNMALSKVRELEGRLGQAQQETVAATSVTRDDLLSLAEDLAGVWESPSSDSGVKQRIIRILNPGDRGGRRRQHPRDCVSHSLGRRSPFRVARR
jgi:transposase